MMLALSSAAFFDQESEGAKAFAIAEGLFSQLLLSNIKQGEPPSRRRCGRSTVSCTPLTALML